MEQALLGAVMVNNDAFHLVSNIVKAKHFYEPLHQAIFDVIGKLVEGGRPANPVTMRQFLPADFKIGGMTIAQYLARMCAEATAVISARDYAKGIVDFAVRRDVLLIAHQTIEHIGANEYDPKRSATELIEEVERRLLDVDQEARSSIDAQELITFEAACTDAVDRAAAAYKLEGRASGVTWGLNNVDTMTGGLHAGELVVLAGRPGMGKSAVAISVAAAAAAQEWGSDLPTGVLLISPEMPAASIAGRLIASMSEGLHYTSLRTGNFKESQFERIVDVVRANRGLRLVIDDTPDISMVGVLSAVRRAKSHFARRGAVLRLVVVDYMQLIRASDRYAGKRVDEVSEISAGLKRMARTESLAVLALSQLSREIERREDKRPLLADLRESGSIEQDADAVVFLYRAIYYLQRSQPDASKDQKKYDEWATACEAARNKLQIIVAKQRNGPTGPNEVFFEAERNILSESEMTVPRRSMAGELPLGDPDPPPHE